MSKKKYFITGGARSGKSTFAETLAAGAPGKRAYIATAQPGDPEMAMRIERHRQKRDAAWDTYEEPLAVADLLTTLHGQYPVVLIDCLTLWLSNVLARTGSERDIIAKTEGLVAAVDQFNGSCIVVSNEVGLGIVPDNPLARQFRDHAGLLNQQMAKIADEAYFMASGIAMRIK